MTTDLDFSKLADAFMTSLFDAMADFDPDEVDVDLSMGVMTLEFSDGTKCIMNRQVAAHQIWLAHGATAWHFAMDEQTASWIDTKGRGELRAVLTALIGQQLGRVIKLS